MAAPIRCRLFAAILLLLSGCAPRGGAALTVSVAASLQDAIAEAARDWPGPRVEFNFGGSGALARQIVSGAPVDVFLSAASKPMDDLSARGLLLPGTRRDLLRNEVVLIAPATSRLASFEGLAGPDVRRIALGDPDSVPAGDYGRQVLKALDLWERVQPKLVLAKDVRQALGYVATGNADAGIVYATDPGRTPNVRVVGAAPPGTHAPIVYPIAVLKSAHNAAAAWSFADFLAGPKARAIFEAHGFRTAAP